MALTLNSVKFLLWARNLGVNFNRTLTLGRQAFIYAPREVRCLLGDFDLPVTEEIRRRLEPQPCMPPTSEEFLKILGANEIVSVDMSDFEGATYLHDLNQRFPENMRGSFDVVFDGGTLEHIFDFPSALKNCLELLAPNGHFISMGGPANQLMGHGFYQISPELYFRVFSPENGFRLRKMIVHDGWKANAPFYEVKDPMQVGRVEVHSSPCLTLGVLAQRVSNSPILKINPQQSDYVAVWQKNKSGDELPRTNQIGSFRKMLSPYWPFWLRLLKGRLTGIMRDGSRTLNNRRGFRRLKYKEIVRDRAD